MKTINTKKILCEAANDLTTIQMLYLNSSDGVKPREIEPYELRGEDFFGYDVEKRGIRRFKLDLIREAKKTNNNFKPRWTLKMQN
jgi:predicted DNA-binding transcriptional regulator YafY